MSESTDIGVFYKALGAVLLIAVIGLLGYGISVQHEFGKVDGLLIGGMIVGAMALIRPDWLDSLVKTAADKLPFLSYKKPPDA